MYVMLTALTRSSDLCFTHLPTRFAGPFIGYGDKQPHVPFNNNNNSKDKNRLVCASGFTPPHWVRANPNYDGNVSDDNVAASEHLHSRSEFPPAAGPSHIWGPEYVNSAVEHSIYPCVISCVIVVIVRLQAISASSEGKRIRRRNGQQCQYCFNSEKQSISVKYNGGK